MKALIAGSGFYKFSGKGTKEVVSTPFGNSIVYNISGNYFIQRHGEKHKVPPMKINYKANIYALKMLGVEEVLTINAVGSLKKAFKPGDFVMAEDFFGLFTPITFYESFEHGLKHTDVTNPFDKKLSNKVIKIAKKIGIKVKTGGIVSTTTGNRFETKAEVKFLAKYSNLVSMTNAYETTLLNEIGIKNANLCVVTNYATGISKKLISHDEVIEIFSSKLKELNRIAELWLSS